METWRLMGYGDDIMASGMAAGARRRGKRIAFGDGRKIIWGPYSSQIFFKNPNIAPPGAEGDPDIEWIKYYKGNRIYNRHDPVKNRWVWNYDFKAKPGEIWSINKGNRSRFVVIEPNFDQSKSCAPNKTWPLDRYQEVADILTRNGINVIQPVHRGSTHILGGIMQRQCKTFTDGLELIAHARCYVGPEGGLHHGAAAVGTGAVVIFGGFIPPSVTGYDSHINLTGGAAEACGSLYRCQHCADALQAITVDEVLDGVDSIWAKHERKI